MLKIFVPAVFLLFAMPVQANDSSPGFIIQSVPDARLVGRGTMRYMMMDIYRAELYAPNGIFSPRGPLALRIIYLRHLRGDLIADRSVQEIRRQGFNDEMRLAAWHDQLKAIIPDVEEDTAITGILTKTGTTIFYRGDRMTGRIDDPAFGPRFFAIWLGPRTSDPDLRTELLHQSG